MRIARFFYNLFPPLNAPAAEESCNEEVYPFELNDNSIEVQESSSIERICRIRLLPQREADASPTLRRTCSNESFLHLNGSAPPALRYTPPSENAPPPLPPKELPANEYEENAFWVERGRQGGDESYALYYLDCDFLAAQGRMDEEVMLTLPSGRVTCPRQVILDLPRWGCYTETFFMNGFPLQVDSSWMQTESPPYGPGLLPTPLLHLLSHFHSALDLDPARFLLLTRFLNQSPRNHILGIVMLDIEKRHQLMLFPNSSLHDTFELITGNPPRIRVRLYGDFLKGTFVDSPLLLGEGESLGSFEGALVVNLAAKTAVLTARHRINWSAINQLRDKFDAHARC